MAHLDPLSREELPQFEQLFDRYDQIRGFLPNSILTMAHRPAIAEAFMQLNHVVLYEGEVSQELKMLISLISSQASGCRYCQAHMANLASRFKHSDEKIHAVWQFASSQLFTPAERVVLRIAHHASSATSEVGDEDFAQLKQHFSAPQIVEIIATIALFGYLSRWNDTLATTLEEVPAKVATRALADQGWEPGKHGQ